MNNTLCWTDIPVTDIDRAITFYSAVLGATVEKHSTPGFGGFALLPHEESNASGCLVIADDNQPSLTGPMIYLSVEGRLDEALDAVRNGGGKVLAEKHQIGPYGFRAIIVDTEGNRLAIHSQVA